MSRWMSLRLAVSLGAVASGCCLCAPTPAAGQLRHETLLPEQQAEAATLRAGAIAGDRSRIPAMLEAARHGSSELLRFTAASALARLGAHEGLAVLDAAVGDIIPPALGRFARVKRARLLAEEAARPVQDPRARAQAKVGRFLDELRLSVEDINRGASVPPGLDLPDAPAPTPIERLALRELADIAYTGPWPACADLPAMRAANFGADGGAALKVRLAPLTRGQRVASIIDDLAHKRVMRSLEDIEIQLLGDEGLDAGRAVAARLQQMETDRQQYTDAGFAALFRVLRCIGNRSLAPVLEHFLHDPDSSVRHHASVYGDVLSGWPVQYAVEY